MISVIIPVHSKGNKVKSIRENISRATTSTETIFVISKELQGLIEPEGHNEQVLVDDRWGKGYALIKGAKKAKGDIVLILHADTLLPDGWDSLIVATLKDPGIAGGGFSYSFDIRSITMKLAIFTTDILFYTRGDLWGDRALFVRSSVLNKCMNSLNVAIWEDLRLSHEMRKHGRVVMLKDKILTCAEKFNKNGVFVHSMSIVNCRVWYALGGNTDTIYEYYYGLRKDKKEK